MLVAHINSTVAWECTVAAAPPSSSEEVRDLTLACLPLSVQSAWLSCCARLRKAFPAAGELLQQGSIMEQTDYLLKD